jgi:hypothetical protein
MSKRNENEQRAAEVERRYVNDLPSRKVIFVLFLLYWLVVARYTCCADFVFDLRTRPESLPPSSFSFLQIVYIRRLFLAL